MRKVWLSLSPSDIEVLSKCKASFTPFVGCRLQSLRSPQLKRQSNLTIHMNLDRFLEQIKILDRVQEDFKLWKSHCNVDTKELNRQLTNMLGRLEAEKEPMNNLARKAGQDSCCGKLQ
ncbi:LOW QUALITY PROTEIN: hypothetical protein OSB04_026597 [Centaurea solstitialis]|uniref:Uncharacterized protein n=1 Tax=Centaurea solstitialis TaxID=347529 RepID=A0AA38SQE8_9ASTR|nr:LOW QUALITY PROTEIN: hypothetical protein OSB04_026597 [Centaurea solstitialis]